ncbi:MAG: Hpt domain-containing protein [Thalassovita sp.]|nr:Hpt domain-containing protein [Thalassovita sp.]
MIDWNRIRDLHGEFGTDDFGEVFDLYLHEMAGVIEKLRHDPIPDDLESDLHLLKSSALNIGFSAFSEKCQTGERQATDGRADRVDLTAIIDCFDQSLSAFTENLPRKFAA